MSGKRSNKLTAVWAKAFMASAACCIVVKLPSAQPSSTTACSESVSFGPSQPLIVACEIAKLTPFLSKMNIKINHTEHCHVHDIVGVAELRLLQIRQKQDLPICSNGERKQYGQHQNPSARPTKCLDSARKRTKQQLGNFDVISRFHNSFRLAFVPEYTPIHCHRL